MIAATATLGGPHIRYVADVFPREIILRGISESPASGSLSRLCITIREGHSYNILYSLSYGVVLEEHKRKVELAGSDREVYRYELSEMIEILRQDIDYSKTP